MEMITNPYKMQPGQSMQQPMTQLLPGQSMQPTGPSYGYPYPTYPSAMPPSAAVPGVPGGATYVSPGSAGGVNPPGLLPLEESYIENILRLNLGKLATIYMTFENNSEWNAKIFKGRLEAAGRDHIIISDPNTGMRYLLLMVNLDYITFDEALQYSPAFGGVPTRR
jgi:spore germination protein Q